MLLDEEQLLRGERVLDGRRAPLVDGGVVVDEVQGSLLHPVEILVFFFDQSYLHGALAVQDLLSSLPLSCSGPARQALLALEAVAPVGHLAGSRNQDFVARLDDFVEVSLEKTLEKYLDSL